MSDFSENMAKEIDERLNGGEFYGGKWYTDGHRSAWINAVKPFADELESLRQKTQYWPDNAERDAVIRHQKEEIERLRAALERMLLEFDFMVESGVISDVRNDIIFVEARAALEVK